MSKDDLGFSRPPLNLLLQPEGIKPNKAWDIDILYLLNIFVDRLRERIDLRICGAAALSTALIYRFKVETFFLFEKLRERRTLIESGEPPPLLELPFRYELFSSDIQELIDTLEKVIDETSKVAARPPPRLVEVVEEEFETDPYQTQILEQLDEFRRALLSMLLVKHEILLSEYQRRMSLMEQIRTFIMLLFVASEGLVTLEQEGDDIKVVGVSSDRTQRTGGS